MLTAGFMSWTAPNIFKQIRVTDINGADKVFCIDVSVWGVVIAHRECVINVASV
jgi:hypothetical protein